MSDVGLLESYEEGLDILFILSKKNRNIVDLKHTNFTLKCLPGVRIMSKLRTLVFMYAERKLT